MAGRKGRSGGRNRKPSHLHLVQGTHRKDRHGSADKARAALRKATTTRRPAPPRWLDGAARREWDRIAPKLHRDGLLRSEDVAALACYCRSYGELQECEAVLREHGRTYRTKQGHEVPRPEVSQARAAAKQVREFALEFGLTPASSDRAKRPERDQDDSIAAIRERAARMKGRIREDD